MQRVLQQSAHAENPVYEKTDDKLPTGAPFVALRLQYFSVDRLTDKARGASAWPAQYETFRGRWSIRDERKQQYPFRSSMKPRHERREGRACRLLSLIATSPATRAARAT
jgi:hypothetical protein